MLNFTSLGVTNASTLRVDHKKAAMENMQDTNLLQLVHLDDLTIEVTEDGKDIHVLIITDHFT